jgi:hypothetical protein
MGGTGGTAGGGGSAGDGGSAGGGGDAPSGGTAGAAATGGAAGTAGTAGAAASGGTAGTAASGGGAGAAGAAGSNGGAGNGGSAGTVGICNGSGGSSGSATIVCPVTARLQADFDGDGLIDCVALGQPTSSAVSLYRGIAGGMVASAPVVTNGILDFADAVAAADFDGDGPSDIFVVQVRYHAEASFSILHGRPNGVFVRANVAASAPQVSPNALDKAISVGDFNKDGRPDVLVGGMTRDLMGCVDLVVVTDVNETPQQIATIAPFCDYGSFKYSTIVWRTIVGDFNGDGKLDCGFIRTYEWMSGGSYLSIAYGNGAGAFTDFYYPALASGTNREVADVQVRDLNNDCQPDLLVTFAGGGPGPPVPFYLNGSTFTLEAVGTACTCAAGATGAGGATGTAGSTGAGGAIGTAGSTGAGGTAGTAGSSGMGGTAASGGTTGTAGSTATGCQATTGTAGAGGITVSVDQTNYLSGTTITVTFAGMPGNPQDWVAIAPAGSANTTYAGWAPTSGATSGTVTITAPAGAGTYVARAFPNNTFALIAESGAFPVSGSGVFTNKSSYVSGEGMVIEYAGLQGNANERIFIAPPGSSATTYVASITTQVVGGIGPIYLQHGATSAGVGTTGTYVARAINISTYTILFESAPYTVTTGTLPPKPTLSTNALTYAGGATISVNYANFPASPNGIMVLTPSLGFNVYGVVLIPGTAGSEIISTAHTNGQTSGCITFPTPGPGSYLARFLWDNTYLALGIQSPAFGVTTGSSGVTISSQSRYAVGAPITVTYTGMPGNADDWIAFTAADDANTVYLSYVQTNGQINGTATLTNSYGPGTYVVRAFAHGTFNLLAQTPFFTVGP